ncbi:MAG: hypothetical protein V3V01_04890 [Acidimicrobiales bacterium]
MATTVQNIIDAAVASSTANDPNISALPAELVGVTDRAMKELYVRAHTRNKWYFATLADVTSGGAAVGWARPGTALDVLIVKSQSGGTSKVIETVGSDVTVVPTDDQVEVAFAPRIYRLGRFYLSVGATGDPSEATDGDILRFIFSHNHTAITDATQTLDVHWPEDHNRLLITKLQEYLALKDKARGDLPPIREELRRLELLFDVDIEQEDSALVARFREEFVPQESEPA